MEAWDLSIKLLLLTVKLLTQFPPRGLQKVDPSIDFCPIKHLSKQLKNHINVNGIETNKTKELSSYSTYIANDSFTSQQILCYNIIQVKGIPYN